MSKKFLAILLIAFLVGIAAAVAYTTWQGTITWDITPPEVKEFSVWGSIDGTDELPDGWADYAGLDPTGYTKDFYLQNDGDVEFTVVVTGTPDGSWGSAVWTGDGMGSYVLTTGAITGARVQATLTLTITGAGSYQFDFDIA